MMSSIDGLFSDEPIGSDLDDRLDRAGFANRAAELLDGVANEAASCVAGLIGAWGSGKTSVLNLVAERMVSKPDWSVVKFNPWVTSDVAGLTLEFIVAIQSALPPDSDARTRIANYARRVAPLTSVASVFGLDPSKAIEAFADLVSGTGSFEAERQKLESELRETGCKILVLVDDVDRLHADELAALLKLVRLVGRLPNVYYVLAYDETTLLDVLSQGVIANGDTRRALAYLDKIVQLRLDLPAVSELSLYGLANEALKRILDANHVQLSEEDRNRFADGYSYAEMVLMEPRLVKRYFGQVGAAFPLVASEVDFVDFALVSFVRTFYPEVYRQLRRQKALLTAAPDRELRRGSGHLSQKVHDLHEATEIVFDYPLGGVLSQLFPDGDVDHTRAIATSEYFGRYFHLTITPDDVSDADVRAVLDEAKAGPVGPLAEQMLTRLADAPDSIVSKLARSEITDPRQARFLLPFAARLEDALRPSNPLCRRIASWFIGTLFPVADLRHPSQLLDQLVPLTAFSTLATAYDYRTLKRLAQITPSETEFASALAQRIEAELESRSADPPSAHSGTDQLLYDWERVAKGPESVRSWLRKTIDRGGPWTAREIVGIFCGESQHLLGTVDTDGIELFIGMEFLQERFTPERDETIEWSTPVEPTWDERLRRAHDKIACALSEPQSNESEPKGGEPS